MIETLRLSSWGTARREEVVEVEYVPSRHYRPGVNVEGRPWRAYDIYIDGAYVGRVTQVTESTDRKINRMRVAGKGRLAWGWSAWKPIAGRSSNLPGLYSPTRRAAVADMLGYGIAQLIRTEPDTIKRAER